MKTYRVEIVFPFVNMTEWRTGTMKIEKVFGFADGAGTRFDQRDMEWCGLTLEKAKRMCKKAKTLPVRGIKVSYEEESGE